MSASPETDFGYPYPQPPSPNPYATVVVIFISFGCLILFVAFLASIWWFMKTRKEKKLIHGMKDVNVDEHLKVHELVMQGPHGQKKVLVSMEDDLHVHKDVHKNEIDMTSKGLHGEHKDGVAEALGNTGGGGSMGSGPSGTTSSSQNLTIPERQV